MNSADPWVLLLVDKLFTGAILLVCAWLLNRKLEAFKATQAHALEALRQRFSTEADMRRSLDERQREWLRETRAALADLATAIAQCNQEIAWLTWRAHDHPVTITRELLAEYDSTVKPCLTEMFRARVRVAALSEDAHKAIAPCVDEIYRLDMSIASAGILLERNKSRAVSLLGGIYHEVEKLYQLLLKTVSDEMRQLTVGQGSGTVD